MSNEPVQPSRPAVEAGGASGLRQFMGLFVVPLLVVAMCISVFVLFGWVAYDRKSVGDYLSDLQDSRSVFSHRRKQAAYELSKILTTDPDALRAEPGAQAELRRLFRTSEDRWVRIYLASVLGHLRDREAVPMLVEGAASEDSQVRIYSIWALGAIADPGSLPVVAAALTDGDEGIRKAAAFAVGSFGDPSVIEQLVVLSEDPVADVRWNAALALARLGDDRGIPVLTQMLDRSLLDRVPDITEEQKIEAMISALNAMTRLPASADRDLVSRLADEDPSLKVRQAAIEARKSLENNAG